MNRVSIFARAAAAGLVAFSPPGRAETPRPPECSDTPSEIGACLATQVEAETAALSELYAAALARAPIQDPTDKRRSRAQLAKAQSAWVAYVDAHCAYVGGIEGGSNSWISVFEETCVRDEYLKRIDFFRHPPSGAD